jgi:hypothetical protein
MYLQLSENGNSTPPPITATDNPFIFVPDFTGNSKGIFVREDYFDDLDDKDWNVLMQQLSPYQPEINAGMSEDYFLSSRAERKARREKKRELKMQKKEAKNAIKFAKSESIKSGNRADIFKNIVSGASSIASSIFGGGGQPSDSVTYDTAPDDTEPETPKKTIWQNPLTYIIGGTVLIGGIALVASARKRKRKN